MGLGDLLREINFEALGRNDQLCFTKCNGTVWLEERERDREGEGKERERGENLQIKRILTQKKFWKTFMRQVNMNAEYDIKKLVFI